MGLLEMTKIENMTPDLEPIVPFARLHIYLANSNQYAQIFSDSTLNNLRANPIRADEAGQFPTIHLKPGYCRLEVRDPDTADLLAVFDNVPVREEHQAGIAFGAQDMPSLIAGSAMSYTTTENVGELILPGDTIMVNSGPYFFNVAEADATDHHLTTNRGVKLYAQPMTESNLSPVQFGAVRDGITDDGNAIAACISYAQENGYTVQLGAGAYGIGPRSKALLDYTRTATSRNNFKIRGEGMSNTRFEILGDCSDFLFKVIGNTDGYSAPQPRASWFDFEGFSINGNGYNVDLFSFVCADRCNLNNIASYDTYGYGVYARQWWDSLCNVRFVECGDNLRIPFNAGTESFSHGQTITGATSGATAWLMDFDGSTNGTLQVTNISGMFVDGEVITGETDGSATATIPNGVEGSEKAVIDFDYQFADRLTDSACNQIKFPETVQIESYRWRALNWGQATRQNYFGGKIHWLINREYGGPAIYLKGPTSNHFVPGTMIAHSYGERAIVVDGTDSNGTGNRFIGISGGQGITMTGDCRENTVMGCAFNNSNGTACVEIQGGHRNMVRDNMPRGDGPELDLSLASDPDWALLERIIYERVRIGKDVPLGGWGLERLSIHDAKQDLLVHVSSGDRFARIEIADGSTVIPLDILVDGDDIQLSGPA